jgi:hypothetical protein
VDRQDFIRLLSPAGQQLLDEVGHRHQYFGRSKGVALNFGLIGDAAAVRWRMAAEEAREE